MEFTGRNRGADGSKIRPEWLGRDTATPVTSYDRYFSGHGRWPSPQSGGGLLPRVGGGPHRARSLAGRVGDLPRRVFRSAEPARRSALDAMADVGFPGRSDILPGGRLCRCGVLEPSACHRGSVAPELAAASTRPRTGADDGLRRAGVGGCCGVGHLWDGALDLGICGLGGGNAPVVSGCISAGGFAYADRFCRTTPLGTLGARWAGVGRGGGRRRLASRPCALLGLAELSALLGNPLSTRNSLAERVIGESPAVTACRLFGCRAGAAHLAGSLPG